jgi:esterase
VPKRPPTCAHETFVDAGTANVRVWRGGDGAPLLVVTDCGDPLELWAAAFVSLSARYDVTMIEQPGFGYSDAGGSFDYRWPAHLDALQRALDQAGVENALGIGHCVAGTQLLAIDAAEPGRVRAVVLAETFPAARYRALGTGLLMHRLARIPGAGELMTRVGGAGGVRRGSRYLLRELGDDPAWVTDDQLDAYTAPILEGHNRRGGLDHVRRFDAAVAAPVEQAATVPAAYLFGAGGHFARHLGERERYAATCGRAVEVLPGAGHFLFAEQPDAFAARASAMLDALRPEPDR